MVKDSFHANIGDCLRNLRLDRGLTLREVASAINIDSSLLAKIEKSKRMPTRKIIKELSFFYKINERELLDEFISDLIVYKVLEEESDANILKVAEVKIKYIKSLQNGNNHN